MRFAVMGAGCVGSVVASRLFDAGDSVALIAEGRRASALAERGLVVNGVRRDIPLAQRGDRIDAVFVCVKNYQLRDACRQLEPYLQSGTVLLPLLNSISPVSVIRECLPGRKVLYGFISKIDTEREAGSFVYNVAGDIHFENAINEEPDGLVCQLKDALLHAGFDVHVDADMVRSVWKKWMLNIGANQVSALTEANYLQFAIIPEIEPLLRSAMGEILKLADAEDVSLDERDVDDLVAYLTSYPYPKKTSMLQDIEAGRKTEIEAISGEAMELARKHGIECPVNETLFNLIRAKEVVREERSRRERDGIRGF